MTQSDIDHAEWREPSNWRGGWLGIYASRRDSRVIVPKRNPRMGWTVNLGRPAGLVLFAALVVLVVGALVLGIVV